MLLQDMKTRGEATVGAFDAKTKLSELLDRVEEGETIVVTRHGVPIARIVPYVQAIDARKVRQAVKQLMDLSRGRQLPEGTSIRDFVEEGRRS